MSGNSAGADRRKDLARSDCDRGPQDRSAAPGSDGLLELGNVCPPETLDHTEEMNEPVAHEHSDDGPAEKVGHVDQLLQPPLSSELPRTR
jgi:hypothetical protein